MAKAKVEAKILGYDPAKPEEREQLLKHLSDEWSSGKSMKEAMGIPDKQLEHIYSIAYHKYQRGEYAQAADLFRYLLIYDIHCYKYILGYAAAVHRNKDYFIAARLYQYATLHEPRDPAPWFHAADCWIHTGELDLAETSLDMVTRIAKLDNRYTELGERANLIRQHIAKTTKESE